MRKAENQLHRMEKKKERKKNNQGKYSQRDGMKDKGMIDLR